MPSSARISKLLHRDALADVLWPDRDEASATNNLHQALYVARRALAGPPRGCAAAHRPEDRLHLARALQ